MISKRLSISSVVYVVIVSISDGSGDGDGSSSNIDNYSGCCSVRSSNGCSIEWN